MGRDRPVHQRRGHRWRAVQLERGRHRVRERVLAPQQQPRAVLEKGTLIGAEPATAEEVSRGFSRGEGDGHREDGQQHPVEGPSRADRAGSHAEAEREQKAQGGDLGPPGGTDGDSEIGVREHEETECRRETQCALHHLRRVTDRTTGDPVGSGFVRAAALRVGLGAVEYRATQVDLCSCLPPTAFVRPTPFWSHPPVTYPVAGIGKSIPHPEPTRIESNLVASRLFPIGDTTGRGGESRGIGRA